MLIHRISYCPSPGHRHPCRLACRRAGRYDEPHKIGWRDEGRDGKRGDNRVVNIVCFPTGVVLCASAPWYIGDGGEGRIPYEAPSSEYMRPVLLAAGRDGQTKRNRISPRLSTRATGRYPRLDIGIRIRCRIRASASYQSLSSSICSAYSSPASRGRTDAQPPRYSPYTSSDTEFCLRRGRVQSMR